MHPRLFFTMFKEFIVNRNFSDGALLKSIWISPNERSDVKGQVLKLPQELRYRHMNMDKIRELPDNTLGGAFAKFLIENKIQIIDPSDKYMHWYEQYPVMTRYIKLHDLFHVVTGFDASIAGEVGVYAFVREQDYSPTLNSAYSTAKLLFTHWWWPRSAESKACHDRGAFLGREAECVLAAPLEDWLEDDLNEVRERLGIHLTATKLASVVDD